MEQTANNAGAEPLTEEALNVSLDKYIKQYLQWPVPDNSTTWQLSSIERLVAYIDKMQQARLAYETPGRTISADTVFQNILNYALLLVYEHDYSLIYNKRSQAEEQALDLMLLAQERYKTQNLQEDNTSSQD